MGKASTTDHTSLARYLGIKPKEAAELIHSGDYVVYSVRQADKATKDYILETLWAFNASFLAAHGKDGVTEETFKSIQANGKCEDNNNVIFHLIEDIDHFVDDAIRCDGRGHFLSSYDHEEIELDNKKLAYRIN